MDDNTENFEGIDELTAPLMGPMPTGPLGPEPIIFIPSDRGSSMFGLLRESLGWTDDYLAAINDPYYPALKDLDQMIEALHAIRSSGRQIVVLPDFDMDGVTSGVLGYAGLAELGFNVGLYVPDYRRGHDIQPEAIDELVSQFPLASAVITCDGGVNSHAGIGRGKALGLTMLVTDHHMQLDHGSPADIIVNPMRIDEDYPHPGICGAFVLWQVLAAYARRYAPHKSRDIDLLKLFAGIGTVSDVMPLLYENRQLVRDSLAIARTLYVPLPSADTATFYDVEQSMLMSLLRSGQHAAPFLAAFEGFALVMRAFREHGPLVPVLDDQGEQYVDDETGEPVFERRPGKLRDVSALNEEFYAFYLAPAFNAIRRVGGSMADAFGAFTAPTAEAKFAHAKAVLDCNELRKAWTETYMEELLAAPQPHAPWVWSTNAPTGMMGLLASKLMQETGMPVVVIGTSNDPSAPRGGSARAPMWFRVISTMTAAGFIAVGHEQACGVRMRDEAGVAEFAAVLRDSAQAVLAAKIADGSLAEASTPALRLGSSPDCDAPLDDTDVLLELGLTLEDARPFGHAFPVPEFELVLNLASCRVDIIGADRSHLRLVTQAGLKILWWGAAEHADELRDRASSPVPGEAVIRLRAKVSVNTFMGMESPQFTVERLVKEGGLDD